MTLHKYELLWPTKEKGFTPFVLEILGARCQYLSLPAQEYYHQEQSNSGKQAHICKLLSISRNKNMFNGKETLKIHNRG